MDLIADLPTTARALAVAEQSLASDPLVSAFVEASAGSGKTKLLTDRILRLMLGGAAPGQIQCLTFTKAAAAEMALRLQHRLGEWVTLDDPTLDARLIDLEVDPSEDARATARALFADVLDLPGGMRIGTIHAFCQSLLRRFPLEAALPPHFRLVDEVDAGAELQSARESALANADPAMVEQVAGLLRAEEFALLVAGLQDKRNRLAPLLALPQPARMAAIDRAAGAPPQNDAAIIQSGVTGPGEPALTHALRLMAAEGSATVRTRACEMLAWLSMSPTARAAHWDDWTGQFFNGHEPRSFGAFPNKKLAEAHPDIAPALIEEQERLFFIEDARRARRCADGTAAMLALAAPALDAYAATKDRAGLLDYTDLIGRTERLLQDPGAAWVLYKLDGGIDHLLLDEVQDTAPEQWRIAHALTEEFFAGLGARDPTRTFFAVGDPKQSIYSFQGADPEEFTRSRHTMATRVQDAGLGWRDVALDVSFRSTIPVLALVDAVFRDHAAADGVTVPGHLRHHADRAGAAGSVELWPLAPAPEGEEGGPAWDLPTRNLGLVSAPQRLADGIADAIATELRRATPLASRGRPVEPGDYLVLVRGRERGAFARTLVRALKARDVPVAGMDRLRLTDQLAVQDVLAACDAILLRDDDLAVAAVLTSPLGGLSDDALMALAMGREGRLWSALRDRAHERTDWGEAWRFLSRLSARADYVSPHALITEALGPLGGRARLLARLGAEAAEPLDELLNAALAYVRLHPPSLQGFVHWLRRSGAEVKREAGAAGSAVRIMTAHGAKGLQAPIVILPDTTGLPPAKETVFWCEGDGLQVPLWAAPRLPPCAAVVRARAVAADLRQREYNRLLYVALTRAEDRLIVCGWAGKARLPDTSWYAVVARGFDAVGAEAVPFEGGWDGEARRYTVDQVTPVPRAAVPDPAQATPPLPAWAGRPGYWHPSPPPEEPPIPRPLAPSRPTGAMFGPVPPATSPLLLSPGPRFARGTAVHVLLQHLPDVPEADRPTLARTYLSRTGLDPAAQATLIDQVLAVLTHPELAPLFGPEGRAEQPLTGMVGTQVVSGVVDRMAVLPDRVLLADYKTGRAAPTDVSETPIRYLRQLAAYRTVLRALFPGRPVSCALVWTDDTVVTPIPDALLDTA